MMSKEAKATIKKIVSGALFFNESMRNHTSLQVGGPAEVLVVPRDDSDLIRLITFASENSIKTTIVGAGTKLLVSDHGVEGIVIKISDCLTDLKLLGCNVEVGAGFKLAKLSQFVGKRGLSGLEFAVGIPGTIGGGVVMNAGAHGFSLSDMVTSVRAITLTGERKEFGKEKLGFGYRSSLFQGSEMIVTSAKLFLRSDSVKSISEKMSSYLKWRKENQPLDFPNAGSIFKNPPNLIAGKLIDEAGLNGYVIGDAKVSEKRGNFIINLGNATASDIISLIDLVKKRVYEKFKVRLECEIRSI